MIAEIAIAFLLQQTPSPETMETRTLHVSIVDEAGRPAHGVFPEDLVVIEDGVAREVVRVSPDPRRLTVAIVIDSSAAMAADYRLLVFNPLVDFLRALPEHARYALWTTGDRPTKILDFADDLGLALSALKRVMPSGGSTLFDAIDEALDDLVEREGERSALVVVSATGVEFSSRDEPRALGNAERSGDVMIFSVLAHSSSTPPSSSALEATPETFESLPRHGYVLDALARESGGRFEDILTFMGVDRVLSRIAADLAGSFIVIYRVPPGDAPLSTSVEVARPSLRVRIHDRRRRR
jgi:VWFA-related protein